MVATHVPFQSIRSSKTLLAHITFVRFLVRVNKLVRFQMIRSTKSLLAQITFVRSLVRVSTHVSDQFSWYFAASGKVKILHSKTRFIAENRKEQSIQNAS